MIEINRLSKIFYNSKKELLKKALSDITLTFPEKGMIFILGRSGSGKSTLLNILGCLDNPTDGDVLVNGVSIKTFDSKSLDFYRNSYIGFIFQEFNLIEDLNVKKNIELAFQLQGFKTDNETIATLLEKVGLNGYENRKPNTLSGGEKQRIAIARCLAKNPSVILADEPTGSLDSENAEIVLNIIKEVSKEKLVVVVTHDREAANKYGDRIIELKDGRVFKDELKNNDNLCNNHTELSLKKSKMPFLTCAKMGVSNIKHKIFRFISSVVLTGIALSFFGVATTVLLFDETKCTYDALKKNHIDSGMLDKDIINNKNIIDYNYIDDKAFSNEKFKDYTHTKISKEEIETLNSTSQNGLKYAGIYSNCNYSFKIKENDDFIDPFSNKLYSCSFFSGFTDCGNSFLTENSMPLIIGHYPEQKDEIGISKYHAQLLSNYYFGNVSETNFSSLIGKTIQIDFNHYNFLEEKGMFKISGIYDTGDISSSYSNEFSKNKNIVGEEFFNAYKNYMSTSYNCVGFVSNDFYLTYFDLFETDIDLFFPTYVCFNNLSMNYKSFFNFDIDEQDSADFLFSRFNKMDLFCFYDNTLNKISFIEPKNNEIYINKSFVEECWLSDIISNFQKIINTIEEADRSNLLPEFRLFLNNKENAFLYNKLKTFSSTFISTKTIDKITSEDKECFAQGNEVLGTFYQSAFKRLYVFKLLNGMRTLNEECSFNNSDLVYGSSFFENYIIPIGEDDVDANIFDECLEYIKNDNELKKIALRYLHYINYIEGSSKECDKYFINISNSLDNNDGKSINDNVWEMFVDSFDRDVALDTLEFNQSDYLINNIKFINGDCEVPSLNMEIKYPDKVYYKNSQGNSGTFNVIGLFKEEYSTKINNAFFANEDYVNIIGTAPESFCYVINDFEYSSEDKGQYNRLIINTDFTLDKVKEIMTIKNGYQYRFVNEEIRAADELFIILEQFYSVTILGCAVFGFFAVLLLINFITNSISFRKKEIGILRCLGARNMDVYKIFMTESFFVSILSAGLASIISIIACSVGNSIICNFFTFNILNFGFLNFVIVLFSCVLFSFIGTLIPILRTSKMTPASIVRHE